MVVGTIDWIVNSKTATVIFTSAIMIGITIAVIIVIAKDTDAALTIFVLLIATTVVATTTVFKIRATVIRAVTVIAGFVIITIKNAFIKTITAATFAIVITMIVTTAAVNCYYFYCSLRIS